MKKLSLIITTLLIAFFVSAQSPEKFSYQAVIRDGDGFLITESTIGMKVSILQGASPVYVETHTPSTDQNAMVFVEIGTGTSTDDFSAIDWANGIFFLKIETDILGGANYTLVSTTQILSVPYALHAKSAETVTGTISENDPIYNGSAAAGISSGDVVNWDEAYSWGNHADAGYLQSFTEVQILTISNDTIYLTGGSYVKLPSGFSGSWDDLSDVPTNLTTIINNNFEGDYSDLTNVPTNVSEFTNDAGYITNANDADADPSNELQMLSISNDTIYLTNGGFVKIPSNNSQSNSLIIGNDTILKPKFVFDSNSTWICPEGVYTIVVEVWGAGGGGGGGSSSFYNEAMFRTANGGNGGKGGHNAATVSVIPGQSYPIIIGVGGTKGINSSGNGNVMVCSTSGNNGGLSSFNGSIIAAGGTGGNSSCARYEPSYQQHGTNGVNGAIINYPISAIPPSRTYIPNGYLYFSASPQANGGTGWQYGGSNSTDGESGLCIIYY